MQKEKYIFTRKTIIGNKVKIRQSIAYLPISLEEKLKQMGKDYSNGETYKTTYPDGTVEVGFDIDDTGIYQKAMPGEKIKRYAVYDYWGNEIKNKNK